MKSSNLPPSWLYDIEPLSSDVIRHAPTNWHRHLANLAEDPKETRKRLLVNKADFPFFENEEDDLALNALIDFLNSCASPVCSVRKDLTFKNVRPEKITPVDTCSDAERIFVDTFDAMWSVTESDNRAIETKHDGWITYVDENFEPIAVKKFNGEKSALSLVPVVIDNRSYPSGSLLKIQSPHIQLPRYSRGVATPLGSITNIKFLRLSGFAHEPDERPDIFTDMDYEKYSSFLSLKEITELTQRNISVSEHVGFEKKLSRKTRRHLTRMAIADTNQ